MKNIKLIATTVLLGTIGIGGLNSISVNASESESLIQITNESDTEDDSTESKATKETTNKESGETKNVDGTVESSEQELNISERKEVQSPKTHGSETGYVYNDKDKDKVKELGIDVKPLEDKAYKNEEKTTYVITKVKEYADKNKTVKTNELRDFINKVTGLTLEVEKKEDKNKTVVKEKYVYTESDNATLTKMGFDVSSLDKLTNNEDKDKLIKEFLKEQYGSYDKYKDKYPDGIERKKLPDVYDLLVKYGFGNLDRDKDGMMGDIQKSNPSKESTKETETSSSSSNNNNGTPKLPQTGSEQGKGLVTTLIGIITGSTLFIKRRN